MNNFHFIWDWEAEWTRAAELPQLFSFSSSE